MAKGKKPFSRIRLVYRRSSPLIKCVVLVTIVLCTAALLALSVTLRQVRQQTQDLQAQAARLEEENQQLEENIAQIGTVESIKRIAVEELDLVDPDTEFFRPVE